MHRGRGPAKQIVAVGRVRTGSSGDPKPQKIHQSRWECSGGLSYDPRDSEARPQVRLDCGPHVASSSISGAPAALDWHHVTLIHHVVRFDRRSAHDLLFEPNYPPGVHESSRKHAKKPSRKSRKQEAASKLTSIRIRSQSSCHFRLICPDLGHRLPSALPLRIKHKVATTRHPQGDKAGNILHSAATLQGL